MDVSRLVAFSLAIAVSAFMTSLAGTFYANYVYYLSPNSMFGMALSVDLILRPIIGGLGTVLGPIIGSFVLTPLSEISRAYFAKGGLEGLHLVLVQSAGHPGGALHAPGHPGLHPARLRPWLKMEE